VVAFKKCSQCGELIEVNEGRTICTCGYLVDSDNVTLPPPHKPGLLSGSQQAGVTQNTAPPPDPVEVPSWAVTFAADALAQGQTVPEIERRLLGRGLDSQVATAAVDQCLGQHVAKNFDDLRRSARRDRLIGVVLCSLGVLLGLLGLLLGITFQFFDSYKYYFHGTSAVMISTGAVLLYRGWRREE
jgi:hypothetical protein